MKRRKEAFSSEEKTCPKERGEKTLNRQEWSGVEQTKKKNYWGLSLERETESYQK